MNLNRVLRFSLLACLLALTDLNPALGQIGVSGWKGVWSDGLQACVESDGHVYFFKQDKFQRYDFDRGEVDMTGTINVDGWTGVFSDLDAAISHPNGKVYFFKGNKYQRFDFKLKAVDRTGVIGVDGWKGVWSDLDAALLHPNGKAYFFKGSKYQRFDFKLEDVDETGAIGKDGWVGIPSESADAVVHRNGKAYFFKDGAYQAYNLQSDRLEFTSAVPGENSVTESDMSISDDGTERSWRTNWITYNKEVRVRQENLLALDSRGNHIRFVVCLRGPRDEVAHIWNTVQDCARQNLTDSVTAAIAASESGPDSMFTAFKSAFSPTFDVCSAMVISANTVLELKQERIAPSWDASAPIDLRQENTP